MKQHALTPSENEKVWPGRGDTVVFVEEADDEDEEDEDEDDKEAFAGEENS